MFKLGVAHGLHRRHGGEPISLYVPNFLDGERNVPG